MTQNKYQQGQLLKLTILSLVTFKKLYEELTFDEDGEKALTEFFETFIAIFNMPRHRYVCIICGYYLEEYLSDNICEMRCIAEILKVKEKHTENPQKTLQILKGMLLHIYGEDFK